MSLTATTLSAAVAANALECYVAAATGATVGGLIQIEQEFAVITAIDSLKITLRSRGADGTAAKAHASGAPAVFLLATDLPTGSAATSPVEIVRDVKYYSAAGAISLPTNKDAVAVIGQGAGAAQAMTLADPSKVTPGVLIYIVSASAYAHTVTLTTGYGGSNATDVFTMSGAVGDSVTLMSLNGTWAHVATGLVAADTVSATVA